MAASQWKVREIDWVTSRTYGKVGRIGDTQLFALYWRTVSKDTVTDKQYTLESFLPGANGGKYHVKDHDSGYRHAAVLLASFIDSVTEI